MTYAELEQNPDDLDVLGAENAIEETYPVMSKRFQELAGKGLMWKFFCLKQKDYGPDNIRGGHDLTRADDRSSALRDTVRRTADKVNRITTLTTKTFEKRGFVRLLKRLKRLPSDMDPRFQELVDEEIRLCSPANETLQDSEVDIAIYGVIMMLVDEGVWGS